MKDFDAARRERGEKEAPLDFRLGGEEFHPIAYYPAGKYLSIVVGGVTVVRYRDFMGDVLPDEEYEIFEKVIERKIDPIDVADVKDVVDWLMAEYAARPTKPLTSSDGGRPSDGDSSKPDTTPTGPDVSSISPSGESSASLSPS
jgi:hypothetical protein